LPESLGMGLKGITVSESISKLGQLREGDPLLVVVRSKGQEERLLEILGDQGVPSTRWNQTDFFKTAGDRGGHHPVYIATGDLSSGFISTSAKISVITEEDIYGKGIRLRRPETRKGAAFISSLEDLRPNDLVVHSHHGIGRFIGLKRLTVEGYASDFIIIEYAGRDKLYQPVDRLDNVQKYTGVEGNGPVMDRLGGTSWGRTKQRVKKRVKEMTEDLLKLYAAREVVEGFSFSMDSHLTREFDATFEYEETEDQLKVIEDVKRDMELAKPMDRIVCGDVGYGKTEVAIRAAFKAALDSKQVAILVPTTLLAEQHYQTFRKRFSPFPVRIEMLSRFRSKQEQKDIIKGVEAGGIDILIGTHRLIQKDVKFNDLGLLVIDEEQRFGVADKERLKHLRKNVDVLTLTATPIPRTLQMSLMGTRDLSVIDTPPHDRLSIKTITAKFDKRIIREAILRELSRGGQVFFVHNRINSIGEMTALLTEIVPEARIATVHGRMSERRLEDLMMRFIAREYDLLLTTTIIESGLDIPSANTIIINRADMFGLAELYQLRGRVGRSGHQAYAYLLLPERRELTDEAKKRIDAIVEFSQLGSGFKVAARDLEIRGAGEVIGREQSGWLSAVGFEMYLRMIEDCVKELKGIRVEEEVDPLLNIPVSAYIPDNYISDSSQRLITYKRLSSAREISDLDGLRLEVEDRFGRPPEEVMNLFMVMELRLFAKKLKIIRVDWKIGSGISIQFSKDNKISNKGIDYLLNP
ncbi:MAG: transcription-repair coupling factor, partial [Nitrospirota bacterium]